VKRPIGRPPGSKSKPGSRRPGPKPKFRESDVEIINRLLKTNSLDLVAAGFGAHPNTLVAFLIRTRGES
jgi:hypothetical protein